MSCKMSDDKDGDSLDGLDSFKQSILELEKETNTLVDSFHLMAADDNDSNQQRHDDPDGSFTLHGPLTEDILDGLPQPLTQLEISGKTTILTPASAKTLARELDWSSLQKLTIQRQPKLGPRGMVPLAQAWPTTTLLELHVVGCRLGHFGVQPLAPLLPNSLQVLNLTNNDIGNDGVWKLLGNGMPPDLQVLDLSANHIGDDGCSQVAQHLPFVQVVKLSRNNIGDGGAHALAQALSSSNEENNENTQEPTRLEELWLDHNQIQEDGASALMDGLDHCSSVKVLDLKGNKGIAESRLHVLDVLLRHRSGNASSSNHLLLDHSMNNSSSRLSSHQDDQFPAMQSILNVNETTLQQELANLQLDRRKGQGELRRLQDKLQSLQALVLKQQQKL